MEKTRVRVLVDVAINGITYHPDDVVDLPLETAKAHSKEGDVDPNPDAVAYALSQNPGATKAHPGQIAPTAAPQEQHARPAAAATATPPQKSQAKPVAA